MSSLKKLAGFFILFLMTITVNGQSEYVEFRNSILDYRTKLYESLKSDPAQEVELKFGSKTYRREPKTPFGQVYEETEYYLSLNEIECIYLLQGNFENLLDILANANFMMNRRRRELTYHMEDANLELGADNPSELWNKSRSYRPWSDSLFMNQGNLLTSNKESILQSIDQSNYIEEIKDFLKVFLDYKIAYESDVYLKTYSVLTNEEVDRLIEDNQMLDSLVKVSGRNFIEQYPNSQFNAFIETFILVKYEMKKRGGGFDFGIGSIVPDGGMSSYLHPSYMYIYLGGKYYLDKVFFNYNAGIGVAGLKQEFVQNDTLWTRGASQFTLNLELGYVFDITDRFSVSPLVGVRKVFNTGADRFDSSSPWCFGVEFNFGEYRNTHYDYINPFLGINHFRQGINVKLLYQQPKYYVAVPELSGGLWTLTVGLNFSSFGLKK